MTSSTKAPPLYPKSHILAASGVAAVLSLALLVFPSREVEAQKTLINLDLDNSAEHAQSLDEADQADPIESRQSPFAAIDDNAIQTQAQQQQLLLKQF